MGVQLDLNGKSKRKPKLEMEILAIEDKGTVCQEPKQKPRQCPSGGNHGFDAEVLNITEEREVDIVGCSTSSDQRLVEAEGRDTTESSSSFGNTMSGEDTLGLSDDEVESQLYDVNKDSSIFNRCGRAVGTRKKKPTDKWRRFIHPLMWRCKWLELRIKEFQLQALKYDTELAKYDGRKQVESENFMLHGFSAKSQPCTNSFQREKVMKRKKRKRDEETTDFASHFSRHNLFSYHAFRNSVSDDAQSDNNIDHKPVNFNDESGFTDKYPFPEDRENDNRQEQILRKIEVAQSKTRRLKKQISRVISENPGKFSAVKGYSWLAPYAGSRSSNQNHSSPNKARDVAPLSRAPTAPQHTFEEGVKEDVLLQEITVPSLEEIITNVPDTMIETESAQQGKSNQKEKEELDYFEKVLYQITGTPQEENPETTSLPQEVPKYASSEEG